jgi:hypothetical protein
VPDTHAPALQTGARLLLHVTQAAPPVPQAWLLVAVTQVVPSQHPFGQVCALQAATGQVAGCAQTPPWHFIELQQFLLDVHASPRLTQRHRPFFVLQS